MGCRMGHFAGESCEGSVEPVRRSVDVTLDPAATKRCVCQDGSRASTKLTVNVSSALGSAGRAFKLRAFRWKNTPFSITHSPIEDPSLR